MRVQRIDIKMKARLPRVRTSWLCLLAALLVVALAARLEESKIFAQDSSQQTVTDYVNDAAPPTPAKPQPPAAKTPANAKAETSSPGEKADPGANASSGAMAAPNSNGASAVAAAPNPEAAPDFPIDPKNPVAVDTATLMKLANTLKSEVDKTTKDTLSVTVVREASKIEQLAHKMRTR